MLYESETTARMEGLVDYLTKDKSYCVYLTSTKDLNERPQRKIIDFDMTDDDHPRRKVGRFPCIEPCHRFLHPEQKTHVEVLSGP